MILKGLKIQCSSIGLCSAHRIGDSEEASYFLSQGQQFLEFAFGDLGRAFFEKDRVLYLIDSGRVLEAQTFVDQATRLAGSAGSAANSQRVLTLLTISQALCDWAVGAKPAAKATLLQLYSDSKRTRLYHHWVLQALIKVFSDAVSADDVGTGLTFARELVEFTTSVKKAKFYRQLATRRTCSEARDMQPSRSEIDPFRGERLVARYGCHGTFR